MAKFFQRRVDVSANDDVIAHARQKAREDAERRVLQDRIQLEYERAEHRAERAIWWQRNGSSVLRSVGFWVLIVVLSLPLMGVPLALALLWRIFRKEPGRR